MKSPAKFVQQTDMVARVMGSGGRIFGEDNWKLDSALRDEVKARAISYADKLQSLVGFGPLGAHRQRRRIFHVLGSFDARFCSLILGWPNALNTVDLSVAYEFARTINARVASGEPVKTWQEKKPEGGYRRLWAFGPLTRARQSLAVEILKVLWGPSNYDFARRGRGRDAALAKVVNNANQKGGARWYLTADIKDCFGFFNREALFKLIPLPRGVIEHSLLITEGVKIIGDLSDLKHTSQIAALMLAHPQLISARLETLSRASFPGPATNDLLPTTTDVQDIQREAARLIASLPDEARELICRLSLMTGTISRERLFTVAKLREPLHEPGAAIDQLVGPWLETLARDQHRTSPLARSAGIDARGREWAVAMHRQLAWVYLAGKSISPNDIFAIFTHAIIGRSMSPLAHVMASILRAGEDAWRAIADACSMFAILGVEQPLDLEKPIDHAVLRIFQLRIASSNSDDARTTAVIAAADRELRGTDDPQLSFFRFLFLMQLLIYANATLPLDAILEYAEEMLTLGADLQATFPARAAAVGLDPDPLAEWPDQAMFAATALVERTVDRAGLEALVDGLEQVVESIRGRLLAAIGRDDEFASFFLDRVWLAEQRGEKDNVSLIALLRRLYGQVVADKAFTSFLAGDRRAALAGLQSVAAALEPLEPIANTEPVRSLQRRVMAVITVVNQAFDGPLNPGDVEKCFGLCSDLSPMRGEGEQPAFDFLALNLVMAGLNEPDVVDLDRWSARIRRTRLLMIRAVAPEPLFRFAVERGRFEHVITDGIRQIEAIGVRAVAQPKDKSSAFAEVGDEPLPWPAQSTEFIILRLIASCFVAAARGEAMQLPIAAWRADIPHRPNAAILSERVDQIDRLLVSRTRDAWTTINDTGVDGWERCIATLALTLSGSCPPERLMSCHAIWLLSLRQQLIRHLCAAPVAGLVAQQWAAAAKVPALLNNPRLAVPAIEAAIAGKAVGWMKIRQILRAALLGVSVPPGHWAHIAIQAPDH